MRQLTVIFQINYEFQGAVITLKHFRLKYLSTYFIGNFLLHHPSSSSANYL